MSHSLVRRPCCPVNSVINTTEAEWYESRIGWLAGAESYAPMLRMMMPDELLTTQA